MKMLVSFRYLIVSVCSTASLLNGGLSATSPSNVALMVGSSATLQCSADTRVNVIIWYFAATGKTFAESVTISQWNGSRCAQSPSYPQYQFNATNVEVGQCDLIITNVTASEAGLYQCGVFQQVGANYFHFAQVTVLYSDPQCSQNVTANVAVNDAVSIKCVVSYSSDGMNVTMSWSSCPYQTLSSRTDVIGNVTYTEHEIFTPALNQQYLQTCSCSIATGEPPTPPPGGALESPTIVYYWNWTSQADIPVQRCPYNVIMSTNSQSILTLGETVTCTADGFPQPTVYDLAVTNMERNETKEVKGPSYTFNTSGEYGIVCGATNNITSGEHGNYSCTEKSVTFTYTIPFEEFTTQISSTRDNSAVSQHKVWCGHWVTCICSIAYVLTIYFCHGFFSVLNR